MTLLTRQQILEADDLRSEIVEVPEWGGSVRVRTMTATERDALGAAITGADGKIDARGYRLQLVSRCVVDEVGAPLFSPADIAALGNKSTLALDRVFGAADRLNVLQEQIEAAAKN